MTPPSSWLRADDSAMHVFEQGLRLEGLEQKVASTGPHGFDSAVDVGESGHQNDRQMRKRLRISLSRVMPSIGSMRTSLTTSDTACWRAVAAPRRRLPRRRPSALPVRGYRIPPRARRVVFDHQNRQSGCHGLAILSSVFSPCRRFDGQQDHELRPFARHRMYIDGTPVCTRDAERDRQTEAGALPAVVKNGSKTRAWTSGAIPAPVSRTPMRSCRPEASAPRITLPPVRTGLQGILEQIHQRAGQALRLPVTTRRQRRR
jgi:hypothetical protein